MTLSLKTKLYMTAVAILFLVIIYCRIKRFFADKKLRRENSIEYAIKTGNFISARAFLMEREEMKGTNQRQSNLQELEFSGIYVLFNSKSNRYYVGQSRAVLNRVSRHLQGHGNAEVYADMMLHKQPFGLRLIPLNGSGYMSINALEKDMIRKYRANETGYNKQKGNE